MKDFKELSPINCEIFVSNLYDYVEREMDAYFSELMDSHLCNCSTCKELEEDYRMIISLSSTLSHSDFPDVPYPSNNKCKLPVLR